MASERQQQILIVEDDLDLCDMLSAYFSVQGYKVLTAAWGKEALKICQEKLPDLVVLDIRLPDIDGYEIARQLKQKRKTQYMPIILLTEKRDRMDKLTGLELGVVDYITKPFDIQELRLRVRNVLRRAAVRPSQDNPVTGLAEGRLVEEQLEKLLKGKEPWILVVVQLHGLSKFRDRYGFVASDDVLRAVSLMIRNVVGAEEKEGDSFVGHLGETEFVLVTTEDELEPLKKRIEERVASSMAYFYPLKDRDEKDADRLRLSVGSLRASDGPFESVDALRGAALRTAEKV